MNKLESLKCIEITSQRQADNGTISYFDPQTKTCYNLYETGYVRRSFGVIKNWTGTYSEKIYQLNPTKMVTEESCYSPGKFYNRKERIMLPTHEERMSCAVKAVSNYRNYVKKNNQSN